MSRKILQEIRHNTKRNIQWRVEAPPVRPKKMPVDGWEKVW